MNSIVFFTKYTEKGPSSRYRSFQYKNIFEKEFNIRYYPLFNDEYIKNLYTNRRTNYYQIVRAYLSRIFQVIKHLGTNKLVVIEYELLPYFPPILEYLLFRTKVRFVIDYDDAIFHNYDLHPNSLIKNLIGNKIYKIVKYANTVITGSPYLSSHLNKYTNNIVEIPTSINFFNYKSSFQLDPIKNDIISIIYFIM